MGCKASKEATTDAVAVENGNKGAPPVSSASAARSSVSPSAKTTPTSNKSSSPGVVKKQESARRKSSRSSGNTKSSSVNSPPDAKILQMLLQARASSGDVTGVWPQMIQMCEHDPLCILYQDPKTRSTPLHIACSMVDYNDGAKDETSVYSIVSGIRALLKGAPESASKRDSMGNIPLHYAIDPVVPPGASGQHERWRIRAAVLRALLPADYESAYEYFSRNDIKFTGDNDLGLCSPLYYALYSIPDDFMSPAPTLGYISVIHEANPQMVSVSNKLDGDKPLALLYRRFTRQFDLSEKFFAGDNSRPEVVEHRRKYKIAASNTWKIIELLLRPEGGEYRIVHRAIQVDCPPDLLRYIVETNAEELTKVDDAGNLPLHYAAKSKPHARSDRESFPAFHTKYVVDELLYKFPEGASIADSEGKFPLTLAVDTGKQWVGGGVKSMYDAYPEALEQIDMDTHPSLQKALSYIDEETSSAIDDARNGIVKDELHDAIMLVQKNNVDVSEVVSAMWAHEEDPGVQMMGCIAISRLSAKASDMEVRRIALSAVPAVVNAMKAHPNEPAVQEKACNSLKMMATADGKREVSFVASGAIAAIVGAMQAHIGDPVVQQEACGALADIVFVGGADRATIVASVSGFTAILNALAAHPDVKMVQKEGCRALQAVTEYPHANLPELPRSQTESLLVNAKEQFPADCAESADVLLLRLS